MSETNEQIVQPMSLAADGSEDSIILIKTKAAQVATASGSDVETELGNRSLVGHRHTVSELTDFPTALKNPSAMTVQLNGGTSEGTNLFTYDGSEAKSMNITYSNVGAAAASHTHKKSEITDFPAIPTKLPNPNALTLSLNGVSQGAYDGSTAKEIDITPAGIGAAASVHTHTKSEITDFPTALKNPASMSVTFNGGTEEGTNKFTYDGSATQNVNITPAGIGAAAASHTHTKSEITDFPTALKNPSSLTIKMNGSDGYAYDGSSAMEVDITPAGIGASAEGHTHEVADITDFPTALKNPSALTIQANGTEVAMYDGSSAKTANLTYANVGAAAASHTHGDADITDLDASKLTGTIDIDRLPKGALERCVVVANDAARFALTTNDVQKGDTVKVTDTSIMYYVVDDTSLSSEAGYEVYTAGSATSVPWSGVTGKPDTFTPSEHTHTVSEITDFPAALKNPSALTIQANGTDVAVYDGSEAKTANLTYTNVGAAAASHTHTKSEITDFPAIPTKLPNPSALTVKLNGGTEEGTNLFTYTGSAEKSINITPTGIGAAASVHTHTKSEITDFPTALKNPSALTIKLNGGTEEGTDMFTYDGSAAKAPNITAASVGAAASVHTHTISQITDIKDAAVKSADKATTVEVPVGTVMFALDSTTTLFATAFGGTWEVVGSIAATVGGADLTFYMFKKTA